MNKKLKILLKICIVITVSLGLFYFSNNALASRWGLDDAARTSGYNKTEGNLIVTAGTVVQVALSLVGFIFFGMILYAGIRWMIARGNDELKQKAKDALTNAVIGLAIVVSAYAITTFIFGQLNKNTVDNNSNNSPGGGCCIDYGPVDTTCNDQPEQGDCSTANYYDKPCSEVEGC